MPTTLLTDNSSDQEEREPLPDKQFSKDFKNNNNSCKEKNISTRTCKSFNNFPLIYSQPFSPPKQHFETLHHHHHPLGKDANTSTAQSRSTNDTLKEEMHHNKEITNSSTPSSHLETAKKRRLDDTEETYESNSISSSSTTPVSKRVNIDQKLSSSNAIVHSQNETKCVNDIAPNHHYLPNSQQPTNHNICNDLAAAASCSNNNNVEEDTSSRIIVPTTSPPNLKTVVSSTSPKNSLPLSSSKPKSVRFADEQLTRSEVLHLIDEEKKRESERQYQEEAQKIKKQYESIGYAPAPVIPASTVSSLPKSHYTISRPTLKINSNLRVNQQLANSTNTATTASTTATTNTTDKIKDITVVNPKNNVKEEIKLNSDKLNSMKSIPKKKPIVVETASPEPNDNNDNSQDQSKPQNLKRNKCEEEKEQEDVFSDEDSDYDPFATTTTTTTEEDQENNPISTHSQGSQLQQLQQQQPSSSSSSSSLPTKIDYFSCSVGVLKKEPKSDSNNNKEEEDDDDFYGYSGNDHWNRIERMYELSKLRKEKIIEANMKLQQEIDNENDDALIKNTKE